MKKDSLEIAYDHYKDTFSYIIEFENQRNQIFFRLTLLMGLLSLFGLFPHSIETLINNIFYEKYSASLTISFGIVQLFLWFILFYYTLRYFQTNISIERQYNYLHKLERNISENCEGLLFEREGNHYLTKYILFSDVVWNAYTKGFPVIFIMIIALKFICDLIYNEHLIFVIFSGILALSTIAIIVIYLYNLHSEKKKINRYSNYESTLITVCFQYLLTIIFSNIPLP